MLISVNLRYPRVRSETTSNRPFGLTQNFQKRLRGLLRASEGMFHADFDSAAPPNVQNYFQSPFAGHKTCSGKLKKHFSPT